ncbi:hypothetical protein [Scytonema sp. NUACC26]|uniref:hypothetical protein n=1 Tax=Scytonema sp. NUACC26 TaxID=3140176 RepID=UPI0034DB7D4A
MAKNFKLSLPSIAVNGLELQLGLGGIHSVDKPGIFRSENGYLLVDMDVTSYYPQAIINYEICPDHLDTTIFISTLIGTLEDRKQYKKRKKEAVIYAALEYGLKISLNAIFGLFGYLNFMLHDLLCTYKTTVVNQLWLLKLIEMLSVEYGYEVISANTDGILLYIPEYDLVPVKCIIRAWEIETGFVMEDAYYDLYARRDVNTYLAKKSDGTIKIKGDFVPGGAYLKPYYKYDLPKHDDGCYLPIKGILKGFEFPVVAIALQKYYLDGIDPETTIYKHNDIYDFCFSQKMGSQYKAFLFSIDRTIITHNDKGHEYAEPRNNDVVLNKQEVQKTLRFFVSRPSIDELGTMSGQILKKVKKEIKKVKIEVYPKQIIPTEYVEERRINPKTGKMKKYRDKVRDREVIPAVYREEMQEVETEAVLASGSFVTLFNDYYPVEHFSEYNIDCQFYLQLCMNEINKIGAINDV